MTNEYQIETGNTEKRDETGLPLGTNREEAEAACKKHGIRITEEVDGFYGIWLAILPEGIEQKFEEDGFWEETDDDGTFVAVTEYP